MERQISLTLQKPIVSWVHEMLGIPCMTDVQRWGCHLHCNALPIFVRGVFWDKSTSFSISRVAFKIHVLIFILHYKLCLLVISYSITRKNINLETPRSASKSESETRPDRIVWTDPKHSTGPTLTHRERASYAKWWRRNYHEMKIQTLHLLEYQSRSTSPWARSSANRKGTDRDSSYKIIAPNQYFNKKLWSNVSPIFQLGVAIPESPDHHKEV